MAEDNTVNQQVAVEQFAKLGYSADTVANGLEAIEALQRIPYEIVFMDCMMPEMDGYEAAVQIRQLERQRAPGFEPRQPVHIIAMTANAMQGDREKCLAAGMNDYVSKPVRTAELKRALEQWRPEGASTSDVPVPPDDRAASSTIRRPESPDWVRQMVFSSTPGNLGPGARSEAPETPVDLERLSEVTSGDEEKLRRLVGNYLRQGEETLKNLEQAIQLGATRILRCRAE